MARLPANTTNFPEAPTVLLLLVIHQVAFVWEALRDRRKKTQEVFIIIIIHFCFVLNERKDRAGRKHIFLLEKSMAFKEGHT